MSEHFGKRLRYSSEPCPNCGRVRLELYENDKQVCEKCQWCPQNNDYVDPYEYLKEQEYDDYISTFNIDKLKQEMIEYLDSITDEELLQELIECGLQLNEESE